MGATEPDVEFERALERMRRGDVAGLEALLDATPRLVHARSASVEPPYDGYFHRATLLHHVAGNPELAPLPREAPALARSLLARGAEVDAVTAAGPSQPADIGWTPLGLVATSAVAREVGVQGTLLDLLLEHGADLDARRGGALIGALYYGELEAAEHLARRGARVDLVAAAALGDVERMQSFVAADGRLLPGAHALVHYSLEPWPDDAGDADVLGKALCLAARCGRVTTLRRLVELGADVDARPPFDHCATPLHWAVIGDQPEALSALLELGADRELRDATHGSTPLGWCRALGRERLAALLER